MPDPDYSVLQRNSQWADRFGGSSTNMAQRRRYAQDQSAYADELLQQQERTVLDEAKYDKNAQNFYFRQQNLQRQIENDRFKRRQDQQKMEFDSQLQPLKLEAETARQRASQAMEISRLNKERRDADQALKVTTNTEAFESGVSDLLQQGHLPGSREFADGVMNLSVKNPYVPSSLRKDFFNQAKIAIDPDEAMAKIAEYRKQNPDLRIGVTADGKYTFSVAPKTATAAKPDSYEQFNKDLKAAKEAHQQQLPADVQKGFEERGRNLENAAGSTQATPPTTAPTATPQAASTPSIQEGTTITNRQTNQRMVFRNGSWQPL